MLFNAVLVGVLIAYVNAKVGALDPRFDSLQTQIDNLQTQMNQRFDDLRDLWRAELHRVEEVLNARLRHLEEQR